MLSLLVWLKVIPFRGVCCNFHEQVFFTWVFPVEIESVKVVLLQELDDAVDELLTLGRILGHGRVLSATLVPTANGQSHFQIWVCVFKVGGLLEARESIVILLKK